MAFLVTAELEGQILFFSEHLLSLISNWKIMAWRAAGLRETPLKDLAEVKFFSGSHVLFCQTTKKDKILTPL